MDPLSPKEDVKDLGIYMTCDCTFEYHIRNVTVESRKMCNQVLRTFETKEASLMVTLFTLFISPKVEYGYQIWSPTKRQDIVKIEMVKKRIDNLKKLNIPRAVDEIKTILSGKERDI